MSEQPVQFRPRRVRWIAVSGAVVLLTMFTVMAVFLRQSDTGVHFRVSDQVALGVVGLLCAAGSLMLLRPRVRADADGVSVRNVFFSEQFAWQEILAVSFPDGASFARLELPQDEYYSVLAVQAMDRAHAVEAVRTLRRLHREAGRSQDAEDDAGEKARASSTGDAGETGTDPG